jgi:hypothetical protein
MAGYSIALVALLPRSPFEWDEVLFMRSLYHFDIAGHSPHPPGYPLYVVLGKLVRLVTGDAQLALQLLSVFAAVGAATGVWAIARRHGASAFAASAAAAVTALTPSFLFYANVGLSDVPATAATVGAALVLAAAAADARRLPLAALACTVAVGIRPQLIPALLPLAALAGVRAVKAKQGRRLGLALGIAVVVPAVVWLIAIGVTGPARFVEVLRTMTAYVADTERPYRLPAAPVGELLESWLVAPFGSTLGAATFWLFVVLGSARWARQRRWGLLYTGAASAAMYLLTAVWTHNMTVALRYWLPALPFLAILAAGVVEHPRRIVRLAGSLALAAWCIAQAAWTLPALTIRSRQAAPTWGALAYILDHFDPQKTRVVFNGLYSPHLEYRLIGRRAGRPPAGGPFACREAKPGVLYSRDDTPEKELLFLEPDPIPGGQVLFQDRWDCEPLLRLSRARYERCAVTRAPPRGMPVFSPDFRVRNDVVELFGTGRIALPDGCPPYYLILTAGALPLSVAVGTQPPRELQPGEKVSYDLWPPATTGLVSITAPANRLARFPPPVLFPLSKVPAATPSGTRRTGRDSNPGPSPGTAEAR